MFKSIKLPPPPKVKVPQPNLGSVGKSIPPSDDSTLPCVLLGCMWLTKRWLTKHWASRLTSLILLLA